jgi:hypothetical protein
MRRTWLGGLALAVAGWALLSLGAWWGLDIETTVLLGFGVGAVTALVASPGPGPRIAAVVIGLVVSMIGYVVRAALLPDTSAGRAVYVGVVIALCVVIAGLTRNRMPLWGLLLGAAAYAGAYEAAYNVAPPELPTTSVDALIAMLLCIAVGFVVGLFAASDEAIGRSYRSRRDDAPEPGESATDPEPKSKPTSEPQPEMEPTK